MFLLKRGLPQDCLNTLVGTHLYCSSRCVIVLHVRTCVNAGVRHDLLHKRTCVNAGVLHDLLHGRTCVNAVVRHDLRVMSTCIANNLAAIGDVYEQ